MLNAGPAKKVTIYVGEDHKYHGHSAYAAILDFLFYKGVAGASVSKGIAGFGADHHLHTTRIERLAENLPIKIEFIESQDKVAEILPKLHDLAGTGLIEIQDTTVAKPPEPAKSRAAHPPSLSQKTHGTARLLRIYVGENDKWNGKPLYRALIECMRANDISGVTVYQGILGYGANRRIQQQKLLTLSHDRPMVLSAIDTEEKLRGFLPILDSMIQQGLVVLSDVEVIHYNYDFQKTGRRAEDRS